MFSGVIHNDSHLRTVEGLCKKKGGYALTELRSTVLCRNS